MQDSKGEDYIKIAFPDLKNRSGLFTDFDTSENIEVKENEDIVELSIHFLAGRSHFKSSKQKRKFLIVSDSDLNKDKINHLMDFIIYDLGNFKKFNKTIGDKDYNEINFDNKKYKLLEFYISTVEENIIPIPQTEYPPGLELRKVHPFIDERNHYRLYIIEWEFKNRDDENGVTIRRKDNPNIKKILFKINSKDSTPPTSSSTSAAKAKALSAYVSKP